MICTPVLNKLGIALAPQHFQTTALIRPDKAVK